MTADTETIALRPEEGRRLILPFHGHTLDGLLVAEGADMPAEGVIVPRGVWAVRCLRDGDAVEVDASAVEAGRKAAQQREDEATQAARKAAPKASSADTTPSTGSPA